MEIAGIGQASDAANAVAVLMEVKKLMELQGELIVKLIESAKVPGPSDRTSVPGLGGRIDFHV